MLLQYCCKCGVEKEFVLQNAVMQNFMEILRWLGLVVTRQVCVTFTTLWRVSTNRDWKSRRHIHMIDWDVSQFTANSEKSQFAVISGNTKNLCPLTTFAFHVLIQKKRARTLLSAQHNKGASFGTMETTQ